MSLIHAFKMDGLGNDFIIIDRRKSKINLSKDKILQIKNRNNVRFDQIIYIEKEINNIIPITIFNSDGNEVSACGNGSRCVAYLLSKEKKTNQIRLKTKNRVLEANIIEDFIVELKMGKPLFQWDKIPLSKKLDNKNISINIDGKQLIEGFCLNIGNPHIIFFVKDCFSYNIKSIGPKIENYEIFPEKINVTFAQVIDDRNILVNVWERGAGLTKACGTAACATGVAASIKKLTINEVNIKFQDGILKIKYDENENIFMTGPVSKIKEIAFEI